MADDSNVVYTNVNYSATPVKSADVDDVFRITPSGQSTTAIGDNFRGFNHRQAPSLIPINKDQYGLTFFTRPRMNLSDGNLRIPAVRKLSTMLSTDENSLPRIIRCWLDPVGNKAGDFTSPYVDPNMPFIPVLSNLLVSLPGWPDPSMPYSTSQAGIRGDQFALYDGTEEINRIVDLTANFRNVSGDPISTLFDYWITYGRGVYFGDLLPHPDSILENEVDYDTRIYRLILDDKKQYVQHIAANLWADPVTTPIGARFNYEADQGDGQLNNGLQQASVHFAGTAVQYDDPILMWEFNQCSEQWFNPAMADGTRQSIYQKIAIDELPIFNYRGYPRINLETHELEWWVPKADYAALTAVLTQYKSTRG